jgi:hypothetical protein
MATAVFRRVVGVVDLFLSALMAALAVVVAAGLPGALARSTREQEDLVFSILALPLAVIVAFALLVLGVVLIRRHQPGWSQRSLCWLALAGAVISLVPVALGAAGGAWFARDYVLYVVPAGAFLASYALVRNALREEGE